MSVNLSFIKLDGKVIDNYEKSLSGWKNKNVNFSDLHKVMSNSNIQFSSYSWRNGFKTVDNFSHDKTDCIILDLDDGLPISSFQRMFSKYQYILATTKSHQQDKKGIRCDRYRVIIPALNIHSNADIHFRALELIAPFSDKQVITKTSSFLGTSDCIIIRNDGKKFDMFKANELAENQLKEEEELARLKKSKQIDPDLRDARYGRLNAETILDMVTHEVMIEVLESVGYEVVKGKISLRDERTNSTKVYSNSVYDFGSGKSHNIFGLLMEYHGFTFPDAIRYVNNYI